MEAENPGTEWRMSTESGKGGWENLKKREKEGEKERIKEASGGVYKWEKN